MFISLDGTSGPPERPLDVLITNTGALSQLYNLRLAVYVLNICITFTFFHCRPYTCYSSRTTMDPERTSRFQHSAVLHCHAVGSFVLHQQNSPDIRPSALPDPEDQHSSLSDCWLPPSSGAFPHWSSDVRDGPLPHCVSSMLIVKDRCLQNFLSRRFALPRRMP